MHFRLHSSVRAWTHRAAASPSEAYWIPLECIMTLSRCLGIERGGGFSSIRGASQCIPMVMLPLTLPLGVFIALKKRQTCQQFDSGALCIFNNIILKLAGFNIFITLRIRVLNGDKFTIQRVYVLLICRSAIIQDKKFLINFVIWLLNYWKLFLQTSPIVWKTNSS